MSKTIQVSVDKVIYRITPKGNLFPLINFNSTKELSKMSIDSIAMPSVADTVNMEIGKGARLRVKFEDEAKNYQPEILEVMKPAIRLESVPTNCPSCTTELFEEDNGNIKCPNVYCAGQSRGMLYRMMKLVNNGTPVDLITAFLDNYVVNDAKNPIDNIQELKLLFGQVKHKNTQAREGNWVKHTPFIAPELWKLELDIEKFLSYEKLPASYFWSICNFPMIEEQQIFELNKLDPDKLLNMEYDLKKLKLSTRTEQYLTSNITFIKFLSVFFNSFGEKTWIV